MDELKLAIGKTSSILFVINACFILIRLSSSATDSSSNVMLEPRVGFEQHMDMIHLLYETHITSIFNVGVVLVDLVYLMWMLVTLPETLVAVQE